MAALRQNRYLRASKKEESCFLAGEEMLNIRSRISESESEREKVEMKAMHRTNNQ